MAGGELNPPWHFQPPGPSQTVTSVAPCILSSYSTPGTDVDNDTDKISVTAQQLMIDGDNFHLLTGGFCRVLQVIFLPF